MTAEPDPLLQAARAVLRRHCDDMRAAVEGLPPEAINWRPPGDDTNSIAVLAHHAWHSTRQWLSVTVEAPPPDRDRAAEFGVSYDSAEDLIARIDEISEECLALIAREQHIDPGAIRTHWDADSDLKFNAAWTLLHALEHLGEHLGHVSLTRQLWDATADSKSSMP
jgi:hypothetical protein